MQIQKLYCPECGHQLDGDYCAVCRRNLVPETARPDAEPVRCSAWMDEWEAALTQLARAVNATPMREMPEREWEKARTAMRALDEIVDALRRHSSIDEVSHGSAEKKL